MDSETRRLFMKNLNFGRMYSRRPTAATFVECDECGELVHELDGMLHITAGPPPTIKERWVCKSCDTKKKRGFDRIIYDDMPRGRSREWRRRYLLT